MEIGDHEDFPRLPPGFRFHPSDEELIMHYLFKKIKLLSLPAAIIAEIELYKYDPWELPRKALFGKNEWFFFTQRDRKYPKGSRPKRSAGSGFWKAMGKDTSIFASSGSRKIGVKKALAFFSGNPAKSVKTDWIMIEYRLPYPSDPSKQNGSMRLDDWVLCRIRQKGNNSKNVSQVDKNPKNKLVDGQFTTISQEFPSSYMTTSGNSDIMSWFKDFQLIGSILAGHDLLTMQETCPSKLLQDDNNGRVYENRDITFGCFDDAYQGWID